MGDKLFYSWLFSWMFFNLYKFLISLNAIFCNFGVSWIWTCFLEHVTSWLHHGWDLAPLVTVSCLIYLKERPYPGHLESSRSKQLPWRPSWQTGVRGWIWHRLEVLGVGGYLASRMSRMSRMLDDSIRFFWMNCLHLFRGMLDAQLKLWSQSLIDGPLSHLWLVMIFLFVRVGDGCQGNASASSSFWRSLGDQLLSVD